ncbi:hypothetical protein [uncultured Roseivirga sp.]|uniref:hypothetical protein n=1 Tax=uncultured Roseivirga sp. TaxID=543088 RepID=UPI000D7A49FE|nr:hypothetical protein [uncultured Roseivirga sp.]PWL30230.1 MAG: hypothetical protein DCO95_10390 [Roseivirga sp. XM-24bin3]
MKKSIIILFFFLFTCVSYSQSDSTQNRSSASEATTENQKYTLDPDSVFFGFSTGASFEFVDGLDNASLFLDLNANLGQVISSRLSTEFGVLSGKFSPTVFNKNDRTSKTLRTEPISDSHYRRVTVSGLEKSNVQYQKKFTRGFAKINYRLWTFENSNKGKLYITGNFEYDRVEFNNSAKIFFTPEDTTEVVSEGARSLLSYSLTLRDTLTANLIQDRSSAMVGLKLFKSEEAFDFFISGLVGHTWIRTVRIDLNTSSGNGASASPLTAHISNRNSFMYVFQGSVLEKKILGAKIGFEIRNLGSGSNESPDYFFFISKQFTMQEFFRLFSPKSSP